MIKYKNILIMLTILMSLTGAIFLSPTSAQAIAEPLQILDIHVSDTSVAFDIKDANLSTDQLYFMECSEIGNELWDKNPRQTRSQIRNNPSSYIQMMVGNLKVNTDYNCYVAVNSSGKYTRHTQQKLIVTGQSLCVSPNVLYQSNCVDPIPACSNPPANSTSCIDKIINGERVERYSFTCLAGYEKLNNECRKVEIEIHEPLQILDIHVSDTSIAFDVKDVNLSQGEEYFMECVEIGNELWDKNPRQTRSQIQNNPSSHIQMMVGNLKVNTDYNCYVAASKPNNQGGRTYFNHSQQKVIITGSTQAIKTFAPPAGYEDEVLTEFQNNPFPDTSINGLEGKAAAELYRRAVIGGFPDGEFKGTRNVNRAEAAKFLLLARGTQVQEMANNGKFWDIKEGQWYVKFVMTAAQKGIISGHPDGSFKPADAVNTVEFIKMLTLAFNLPKNLNYSYSDVQASDWFAQYAGTAQKYNLFPKRSSGNLQPSRSLSRNEVAVAIYQYLSNR